MTTEIWNEATMSAPAAPTAPAAPPDQALVSITPRAAEKAKALLEERGGLSLRVFVAGGGCSGHQYGMAVGQEPEAGDSVIDSEGVRILVDADSVQYLGGAEIDYTEDLMKSGFTIHNPNAVSSCACGSSFQTADGSGQARPC